MLNNILKQIHFLLKRTLSSGESVKITFSLFSLLFVYLKDAIKFIMAKKDVLGKDLFIGTNLWKYQGYERFLETYQSLKHDLPSIIFISNNKERVYGIVNHVPFISKLHLVFLCQCYVIKAHHNAYINGCVLNITQNVLTWAIKTYPNLSYLPTHVFTNEQLHLISRSIFFFKLHSNR